MNVNVISKTDNAVLERKEIEAEVTFSGPTPSREELRKEISGKVGANPDLMVLREVQNTFGSQSVKVIAHAYSNKEKMVATEPGYMVKRDKLVEEEKPKEEKKEEKPAEKPKEEKKEEKAAEKPKEEAKPEEKKEEKPADKPKEEAKPAEKKEEKPEEKPKEEKKE